ncbi:MAG: pilin [Nitrospinae bacterium]|nr:pilin [Nitrospinota bacterium]
MRGDSGFTLVELLITVSIIGILSVIAIPQFNSYRQRVYDTTAKSDMTQFRNAVINAGSGSSWSTWQTGPAQHSRFSDVKISNGVKMLTVSWNIGGAYVFYAYTCHPNGKMGYFMYVPYGGTDPFAGWGWAPNRIEESTVYYLAFC